LDNNKKSEYILLEIVNFNSSRGVSISVYQSVVILMRFKTQKPPARKQPVVLAVIYLVLPLTHTLNCVQFTINIYKPDRSTSTDASCN